VPDQILVAFIAKLTLYEFRCDKGQFAELLKVLEKDDAAPVVVAVSRNVESFGEGCAMALTGAAVPR
jgi:hypothetical protein